MADGNIRVPADSTGKRVDTTELTVGADTVERQRIQIAGAAAADLAPVDATKGLRVDLANTGANATPIKVDGSAVTQPVSGTFFQATQPVSAASLPLPTGASTAAKQPALGTAGTASTDVITVQGITSMTPLLVNGSGVTQPVSGTVTANMGTVTADPFGANADAASATGSISAKLRFIAGTGIPITGTVTVASHAVTNAGTFAVQATIAAGAAAIAKAEDVASADADVGVPAMAVRKAAPANTSGTDGDYEMLQMSAGRLWVDPSGVTLTVAAHAVTNAGTFATQVDGAALTALQLIDDTVFTDDAAFTPATSKVSMAGFQADESSTDSIDEGDAGAARMTLDRKQIVAGYAHGPAGGWSQATGSIAATKTDIGTANTPGQVGGWYIYNPNASVAYVQFFNTQASGVTLGTTPPVYSLGIPAGAAANVTPGMAGLQHTTAISIAVTTTRAGSTGPGSTVDYNIFYKQ